MVSLIGLLKVILLTHCCRPSHHHLRRIFAVKGSCLAIAWNIPSAPFPVHIPEFNTEQSFMRDRVKGVLWVENVLNGKAGTQRRSLPYRINAPIIVENSMFDIAVHIQIITYGQRQATLSWYQACKAQQRLSCRQSCTSYRVFTVNAHHPSKTQKSIKPL